MRRVVNAVVDVSANCSSLKASYSRAENIIINNVGARVQPCFTPWRLEKAEMR